MNIYNVFYFKFRIGELEVTLKEIQKSNCRLMNQLKYLEGVKEVFLVKIF